jgi:hypothetical protein
MPSHASHLQNLSMIMKTIDFIVTLNEIEVQEKKSFDHE